MATTGSFDFNLTSVSNLTNNATEATSAITEEIANQGSVIGLGIAISLSLLLIFGAVLIVLNFIPTLIGKVKNIKGGN